MAKVSKAEVDKKLREFVFNTLFNDTVIAETGVEFTKINDRQYGIIITDANGEQRYVRIGAIVAELRDDMTAEELMQREIDAYHQKQIEKAEKLREKERKIAVDKAAREARALRTKEKEEEVSES